MWKATSSPLSAASAAAAATYPSVSGKVPKRFLKAAVESASAAF